MVLKSVVIATVTTENIVTVWATSTHLTVPVLFSNAFIHLKNITMSIPRSGRGEDSRWARGQHTIDHCTDEGSDKTSSLCEVIHDSMHEWRNPG